MRKFLFVSVRGLSRFVRREVACEVLQHKVLVGHGAVPAKKQDMVEFVERIWRVGREHAAHKVIKHAADHCVRFVHMAGTVGVVLIKPLNLFGRMAEYDDVIAAELLEHFNIGPVERAERNGAVHHEFHIARTGRFLAGGGYLLADVGRWNEQFRRGNVIVFKEHDL
ncbi:hypothetical protein SDC9_191079 [bioreactor metagenome]|uniref:Uncharacterized protein n=1 Tax=bioreactor metagenome TaxID=1076179 RepID=A0A645HZ94_9ZZZZ